MNSVYKSSHVGAMLRLPISEMACMCSSVGVIASCRPVTAVVRAELPKLIITPELSKCPWPPCLLGLTPGVQLQWRVRIRPGFGLENAISPL